MSILGRDKPSVNDVGTAGRTPIATLVGTGSRIDGTVECDGTVRVDGKVHGDMQCREAVIIGETGYIEADVTATVIVIAGELHGNASASESIELLPTGKLYGDAIAPSIALSKGAFVRGRCETTTQEDTSPHIAQIDVPEEDEVAEPLETLT